MRARAVTRREAAGFAAASAAALFVSACGDSSDASETARFGDGDVGVVNYLLTLEHISAAFYREVERSKLFDGDERKALAEFGRQEDQHVALLTKTVERLGGSPARPPSTSLRLQSRRSALSLAGRLEDAVAAAYLGQVNNVDDRHTLAVLAAIHTVEGRHAATVSLMSGGSLSPEGAFAEGAPAGRVLRSLRPIASV